MKYGMRFIGFTLGCLLSSAALADITFQLASPGQCGNLSGKWYGSGAVKDINCEYDGSGNISGQGDFAIELTLKRTKFSLLCPKKLDQSLTGTCDDATGQVTIHNEHVSLEGDVEQQGGHLAMSLSGEINADVFKAHMTADLTKG